MFNRFLLGVIGIISIAWISWVGAYLLDKSDRITPENIFDTKDGELLIVNKMGELQLEKLNFKFSEATSALFLQLGQIPWKNERIFVSQNRPIVLIELPVLWSESLVKSYFKKKAISCQLSSDKTVRLDIGFRGKFERNYLVLYKGDYFPTQEEITWPNWDRKSTASIIHLKQPSISTDIYFKIDGSVSYQTKLAKNIHSSKVDDQDLFAEVLPNKLMNYHFYEKKFALSTGVFTTKSPMFQWVESGFVTFDYNGKKCIISDYQSGQDPFEILAELYPLRSDSSIEKLKKYQQISLTKTFPANVSGGFYMQFVADKLVMSESKDACQAIVADYELGKTIALTEGKKNQIYLALPQKVSERNVTESAAYTQTAYKNRLLKTQIFRTIAKENQSVEEPTIESWSQTIDGNVIQFIGKRNQQFVWTSAGKLLSISAKQIQWKLNFEGTLLSDPKLVDWQGTGSEFLLFNTDSKVYLINSAGGNVAGFPVTIANSAANGVAFYRSKNASNLVLIDESGALIHLDAKGKISSMLKLKVGMCKNPVDVIFQKNIPIAIVSGSDKTVTVHLTKNKILKTLPAINQERIAVQGDNGPNYFAFQNGSLKKMDYSGNETILSNYPGAKLFKITESSNFAYVSFVSYNKIHVLNQQGIKLFQVDIPFKELIAYDLITLSNGKTYVAMLDGIENNVFVVDRNGMNYTPKPLEGKENVILSEKGNSNLVVTTTGNGYVVQYFDVLNQGKQVTGQTE